MSAPVFVLGSFVVDVAYRTPRLPAWGETLLGAGFALGPGGKGSNQAVAAARAGARVSLLTAVGPDAFGAMGWELWAAEGIETASVRTSELPTGSAAILIDDASASNAIIVVPGACGTLTPADVDRGLHELQAARVFITQLEIPLPAVERGLQLAREAGVFTILNPAPGPAEPLSPSLLALVDFLIPNETEAQQLTGLSVGSPEQDQQAAQALLAMGVGTVILTLGERGSLLCPSSGQPVTIPPVNAGPVVETTGAGDAFCGAFATALAEGRSAESAARFASATAGLAVTRAGTAPSMPRRTEIDALLAYL